MTIARRTRSRDRLLMYDCAGEAHLAKYAVGEKKQPHFTVRGRESPLQQPGSEAAIARHRHRRSAPLRPGQPDKNKSVGLQFPSYLDAAALVRERAVLDRIGRKLVKRHVERERGVGRDPDLRTVDAKSACVRR